MRAMSSRVSGVKLSRTSLREIVAVIGHAVEDRM
jgi:hypothetical protein